MNASKPGGLMYITKWLQNNRVIAGLFAACVLLNALAIMNGYYG